MKKLLLFIISLIVFSVFVQASENINECMNDIYFANGINTSKDDARKQLLTLVKPNVLKDQFKLDENKMNQVVDFKLAYNNTLGIAFDLLEAYGQKKAEHDTFWWTLGTIYDVFGGIAKQGLKELTSEGLEALIVETLKKTASQFIVDPLIDEAGLTDLAKLMKDLRSGISPGNVWDTLVDSAAVLENYDATKQLGSYKNSIKLGHSAIVIAHSQGNLFTNVVYEKIATDSNDKWMTKYFYMIGVASPADGSNKGPQKIDIVTFDNDPISYIPGSIGETIRNPMRYIEWRYSRDNNGGTKPGNCLDRQYVDGSVPNSCVDIDDPEYDFWSPVDKGVIDFHLFSYYMSTEISKTKIMNFVDTSLKAHSEAKSQWIKKEERNKNTCDYKITVKHQYDPSIEMPLNVYPFNLEGKLYEVNGEYIKASCGGNNILETWEGKKDNECLMIDNPEEEKITIYNKKYIFRIRTIINIIGTCNKSLQYPINVKDRYSNRVQLGVYDYGDKKIIDLSTSFLAENSSECVETLKSKVVSVYNEAQNIVNGELIKIDGYLRKIFPTALISYGIKDDYYLEKGCYHADISPGKREDLGYRCLDGFNQKVYIESFE